MLTHNDYMRPADLKLYLEAEPPMRDLDTNPDEWMPTNWGARPCPLA
jgi:hypothetical protein